MPRAAGSGTHYEWVLRNKYNGQYNHDSTIELPSVTSVIKSTLAAPALVGWAYRSTRDAISGTVGVLASDPALRPEDIVDMVEDADWLEEYLKENRLRPEDVRDARGEVGTTAHLSLEKLAEAEAPLDLAEKLQANPRSTPEQRAVASWFLEAKPTIVATEKIMYSLRHRFSGTVDLIWQDQSGKRILTDLKSRRAGLGVYTSDEAQVGGYQIMYEEMTGLKIDQRSVLLAQDDGKYLEEPVTTSPEVFLHLLAAYRLLKGESGAV